MEKIKEVIESYKAENGIEGKMTKENKNQGETNEF